MKVGVQCVGRRNVRAAGLYVLDDFLQGDDQILRLLLRQLNLLSRIPARLQCSRQMRSRGGRVLRYRQRLRRARHVEASLERHKETFGNAPEVYGLDRGFFSVENIEVCGQLGRKRCPSLKAGLLP
jgi:hypothetical protein